MENYQVTGMSCAACSARVEKAVSRLPGVESCTVSLLTGAMMVEGTVPQDEILRAVKAAGYKALPRDAAASREDDPFQTEADLLADRETPALKKRLGISLPLLLVLMYFSMGHTMWHWPAPALFDNPVFLGVFQMLLALSVMAINGRFFTSGFSSLLHRAPNMDTLVALGSGVSFLFSLAQLLLMFQAQEEGQPDKVMALSMNMYFESAAMIPSLITVGKLLEAISKGHTTDALKGLMQLAPQTAFLLRDGVETTVPIREVRAGDIFLVYPGGQIPVDGVILKGTTAVDESPLTGESLPVDKTEGDPVSTATINGQGHIRCKATRVGEDTTLAQIIRTVSDAAATKAPIGRIADKVSGVFVPVVIALSALTLAGWLLAGFPFPYAITRGISVLVISCPCALGLATPVAIMVGSGVGARSGLLFKTAASLEAAGKTRLIALDKTGTITQGQPVVTDLIPSGRSQQELLCLAAALEKNSEHPLAKAVTAAADGLSLPEVEAFSALPGQGIRGNLEGKELLGGSPAFFVTRGLVGDEMMEQARTLAEEGKTTLLFALDGALIGMIAVADSIREDSARAITQLKEMGIRTVMLTGDNRRTAKAISRRAGVDQTAAELLPNDKAKVVSRLKELGPVAMVGDGINDAPALTVADSGIAIGAGTDVALDAADIVVMHSRLSDVAAAIRLSRATMKNIRQNLFWAFFYNALCIPLAMGLYGVEMKPMYGAAAMALSSFFVCMNALRLNLVNLRDPKRSRGTKPISAAALEQCILSLKDKEEPSMKKTLKVEGMMCTHCEARVRKALEALPGVAEAAADHTAGTATVTMSSPVSDEELRNAVEAQDYKVLGVD